MKRILLYPGDVVTLKSDESFTLTPTSRSVELVKSLLKKYRHEPNGKGGWYILSDDLSERWLSKGVEAEVLQTEKGWRTGKVRVSIEFIPDEEEEEEVEVEVSDEASPQKALPPSPLDDLRQKLESSNNQ